jgi:hypothetical protein
MGARRYFEEMTPLRNTKVIFKGEKPKFLDSGKKLINHSGTTVSNWQPNFCSSYTIV